jgi:hypothetical protein
MHIFNLIEKTIIYIETGTETKINEIIKRRNCHVVLHAPGRKDVCHKNWIRNLYLKHNSDKLNNRK